MNTGIDKKPIIGFTCGDINGIGLEVILKTLMEPALAEICVPVLFSSQKTVSYYRKVLGLEGFIIFFSNRFNFSSDLFHQKFPQTTLPKHLPSSQSQHQRHEHFEQ